MRTRERHQGAEHVDETGDPLKYGYLVVVNNTIYNFDYFLMGFANLPMISYLFIKKKTKNKKIT